MACSATRTMPQSLNPNTHPFFSQQPKDAKAVRDQPSKQSASRLQGDSPQDLSSVRNQQKKSATSSDLTTSTLVHGSEALHHHETFDTQQPLERSVSAKRPPDLSADSFGETSKDDTKPRRRRKRKLNDPFPSSSSFSPSLVSWIDKGRLGAQRPNEPPNASWDEIESRRLQGEIIHLDDDDSPESRSTGDPQVPYSVFKVAGTQTVVSQASIEATAETQKQNSNLRLDGDEARSIPRTHIDLDTQSRSIRDILMDGPERVRHKKVKKSLLTRLKYGQDDPKRRERIGKQIRDILVGCETRTESLEFSKPSPHAASNTNHSRPLHPFFTGNQIPAEDSSSFLKSDKQAPPQNSQHLTQSPAKSFSTPRRPVSRSIFASQPIPTMENPTYTHYLSQKFRLPGTYDPPWPCKNFTTLSRDGMRDRESPNSKPCIRCFHPRKDKQLQFRIPRESSIVQQFTESMFPTTKAYSQPSTKISQSACASRTILTGLELKHSISKRLPAVVIQMLQNPQKTGTYTYPALSRLWDKLDSTLSQFDRAKHESVPWTSKHCPISAEEVLQDRRIMLRIKSWLEGQTVGTFDASMMHKSSSKQLQNLGKQRRNKRRKVSTDMENFLVSSDEEFEEMREISDDEVSPSLGQGVPSRSLIRGPSAADATSALRHANAVLFSGPHGVGKTACAYALAKELGFEIFEINAGTRRSGKDVLEKVGDMSLNHQVHKSHFDQRERDVDRSTREATPPPESFPSQSNKLTSFFKYSSKQKSSKSPDNYNRHSEGPKQQPIPQKASAAGQMQSVILIEEVDVLFEEDKQFWEAVQDLASRSKRPIIMTCNDENLVPLQDLSLHAIVRFQQPPSQLAAAYLLLVAATEGHLLPMESTEALFEATGQDLRAALTNIQFFCQIGIGDLSNGLDWLLKRWPPGVDQDQEGRVKRIISERTLDPLQTLPGYQAGQGDGRPKGSQDEFVEHVSEEWLFDSLDLASSNLRSHIAPALNASVDNNALSNNFDMSLEEYESAFDYLSAADVICRAGSSRIWSNSNKLDPSQPLISEKSNYTQGHQILQADQLIDYSRLSQKIAASTSVGIIRCFNTSTNTNSDILEKSTSFEFSPQRLFKLFNPSAQAARDNVTAQYGFESADKLRLRMKQYQQDLSVTLDPLAYNSNYPSSNPGTLDLTCLDSPGSIVSSEVAPYIRAIVAYDKTLLELQSDDTTENNNKKRRTTRASRSALLGSKRDVTRRERWLPEDLDYDRALKTGCSAWPVNACNDEIYESGLREGAESYDHRAINTYT